MSEKKALVDPHLDEVDGRRSCVSCECPSATIVDGFADPDSHVSV